MKPIPYEKASREVKAVFDDIKATRKVADVNNFWKMLANEPRMLKQTWESLKAMMGEGALDPKLKELIYVAVSVTNNCDYCMASHTAAARAKGATDAEINELYAGRDLLLVGVLKGAVFFMADLMRSITVPCEIDFMAISSYGVGVRESTGNIRIGLDLQQNIENRHVLVVEDIVDTGHTIAAVLTMLATRHPASLKICTLLDKSERREITRAGLLPDRN